MIWRLLIFFLVFQTEIRVRAGAENGPLGDPKNCWQEYAGACSVLAGRRPLQLRISSTEIWAEGESLLERSSTDWKFLKGAVRVRSESAARLAFPFGTAKSEKGEFWILEKGARFWVRATQGPVWVTTLDGRELEVPEGLEIWLGTYNRAGVQSFGVPSLIDVEDHLRRWSGLGDVSKEQFLLQARELRTKWQGREAVAAGLYQTVIKRHVASVEEAEARKIRQQSEEKARQEKFREMLRERAFHR